METRRGPPTPTRTVPPASRPLGKLTARRPGPEPSPPRLAGVSGLTPRATALAVTLAPCWSSHDLCLYGLGHLSDLWSVLYPQPESTRADSVSPGRITGRIMLPSGRPADHETTRAATLCPPAQDLMNEATLRQALATRPAAGPSSPASGQKIPRHPHGYKDALPKSSRARMVRPRQAGNLAIATGTPGHGRPRCRGPARPKTESGYPGLAACVGRTGNGAAAYVRTRPAHATPTLRARDQARWPASQHHLDFPRPRGYIPRPPSQVRRKALPAHRRSGGHGTLTGPNHRTAGTPLHHEHRH